MQSNQIREELFIDGEQPFENSDFLYSSSSESERKPSESRLVPVTVQKKELMPVLNTYESDEVDCSLLKKNLETTFK